MTSDKSWSFSGKNRFARVTSEKGSFGQSLLDTVKDYLPSNYSAVEMVGEILIIGEDDAGWTLDGYVLPRLRSAVIAAVEIPRSEAISLMAMDFKVWDAVNRTEEEE